MVCQGREIQARPGLCVVVILVDFPNPIRNPALSMDIPEQQLHAAVPVLLHPGLHLLLRPGREFLVPQNGLYKMVDGLFHFPVKMRPCLIHVHDMVHNACIAVHVSVFICKLPQEMDVVILVHHNSRVDRAVAVIIGHDHGFRPLLPL